MWWTILGLLILAGFVYLTVKMRKLNSLPYLTDDKIDRAPGGGSEADRSGIRKRRRL